MPAKTTNNEISQRRTKSNSKPKPKVPVASSKAVDSTSEKKGNKRPRSPEGDSTSKRSKPTTQKHSKQAISATEPASIEIPTPTFCGNFDIYSMKLPFLNKPYLAKGTGEPQYEAVYNEIVALQAKSDYTGRCYLGSTTDSSPSRFESHDMEDPMEDMPFEIAINSTKRVGDLTFTKAELSSFASPTSATTGPGISGVLALAESHCGVRSASGAFKMQRVWTKRTSDEFFVELFEGFISFNVAYSGMYARKGHGNGQNLSFGFWGVRARHANGKEIGLCPIPPLDLANPPQSAEMAPAPKAVVPNVVPVAGGSKPNGTPQTLNPPRFAGNFDIYQMALEDDLHEAYLPDGSQTPHFEGVYKAILESSTAHAAQLYLGGSSLGEIHGNIDDSDDDPDDSDSESRGRMMGESIKDPIVEQPYNIVLTSIDEEDSVSFTDEELGDFPERDLDPSGPGMVAQIELSSEGHHGVVAQSGGQLKLVRVWAQRGANGELQELFEGYFNLQVGFVMKYAKKVGFEELQGFSFWAVRAKKDGNGREIGLSIKQQNTHGCGY